MIGRPESDYVESVLQIVSKANRKLFDELSEEEACAFMDITIEQYREYKTRMKEGDAKKH